MSAYTGPARHYHGLDHIDALLSLSAQHRAELRDPVAVDIAIYFHDAVYDPARRDNEMASAALARTELGMLGARRDLIDTVAAYIEATAHTAATALAHPGHDTDLDHLLDFDLSALAAEPHNYDAYALAIRREYAIYPDDAYARGRARVLEGLLESKCLYRVPALSAMWEVRARANLARELASLRG